MKPAAFEIARPRHVTEVLDLLSLHQDAKIIAGGQSLVPLMNLRIATPALLIDLGAVVGLAGISMVEGELRIGAMTRQKDLLNHPLIKASAPLVAAAMPHVGHVQTRNRGTMGGSLAHADPDAELPLVMSALNATLIALSKRGARKIMAREFFVDALTTELKPDELLTEIRLSPASKSARVAFREFARSHGDSAMAAAAVQFGEHEDGAELLAAIGGIGSVPHVCHELSAAFADGIPPAGRITELIEKEIASLQPRADLKASGDYRRHLARVSLIDSLKRVIT
jgi:CO/xanthine dehydrogenase FAD-binding subunit